jgi:hypothetical protein
MCFVRRKWKLWLCVVILKEGGGGGDDNGDMGVMVNVRKCLEDGP